MVHIFVAKSVMRASLRHLKDVVFFLNQHNYMKYSIHTYIYTFMLLSDMKTLIIIRCITCMYEIVINEMEKKASSDEN